MARAPGVWQAWFSKNDALVFPLGVALVLRLAISALGIFVVAAAGHPIQPYDQAYYHGVIPLVPAGWNWLTAPFQRWDAVWYEVNAARGYAATDQSAAFFPLFPLLARTLALGTGMVQLPELLISTVCIAASYILFYRVAQQLFDRTTARLGLVAWATFPTTFFLFIPYAEALFTLCAILCLETARQKRWLAAGIAGGLAALTRSPGVWLTIPLAVEWLAQVRPAAWRTRVQTALALLLVPLGLLLYMAYLQFAFGDAFLWVRAVAVWGNTFSAPWDTMLITARAIFTGDPGSRANNIVDLAATLYVLVLLVLGLAKQQLPLSYLVYGLVFLIFPLSEIAHASNVDVTPMASAARRAVVIFPAFLISGTLLKGRLRAPLYFVASAALQVLLIVVFVNWLWVD